MIIVDLFLLAVLKDGFERFSKQTETLRDIFFMDTPLDISRLQTVLSTPKKLNIIQGFPPAVPKDATIALTLGEVEEDDQFVAGAEQIQKAITYGDSRDRLFDNNLFGSMFAGTWRITVYSVNADLAVRLAYIVKYILLSYREYLARAGLLEQHISMADFEPIPEYLPDLVYVRAVMLKCKTLDTFKDFETVEPVADFVVEEEFASPIIT